MSVIIIPTSLGLIQVAIPRASNSRNYLGISPYKTLLMERFCCSLTVNVSSFSSSELKNGINNVVKIFASSETLILSSCPKKMNGVNFLHISLGKRAFYKKKWYFLCHSSLSILAFPNADSIVGPYIRKKWTNLLFFLLYIVQIDSDARMILQETQSNLISMFPMNLSWLVSSHSTLQCK